MSFIKSSALLALVSTALALPKDLGKLGCTALPLGSGPVPTPDTAEAFLALNAFSQAAKAASCPSGYGNTFTDLKAASDTQSYLTYSTLLSYDVDACAASCTANNACTSFNIYFERSPTVNPSADCANPPSTTQIKCALFGGPVNADNAKNSGQYRDNFEVAIAGSNGYVNVGVRDVDGFRSQYLGDGAIEAPLDCYGGQTYMGYKQFDISKATPYSVARCAAACQETSAYNARHPPTDGSETPICNFFNSYILNKDGVPQAQICSLYTRSWPAMYATNVGQYRGQDQYTISWSFSYENSSIPCDACVPVKGM